ncbi:hypothetical protein GLOIN_2v1838829 [Rhizophagus irregularis DAOM 181602=DAOM 197198]|uniref:Uncharacterized protein n=1 Tax=Rhizophagus irregularis (strain DAOM 181602 / DAOM 197198 / MUCL 43194) TaxID=747089 RepID=A0A2P4QC54_RHIID|nr:hypothetical protein GLOIN_2v1838829 [Rhizophagus irregularis DAOM 181602=DAOM 197198]POG75206.1 hypothetical protein GLOIN_2v1838829 [Rhizophagus irregularis DAOM 181602=DAOM 197198]|eukprot:XP_025182072.1 hypothetical protein GLOIN_2v1838829 [Rhizophagus irregularis DAOM 181602=DAOM 197198]
MASKMLKNAKNSKKRKQALDILEGQRRKQALDVPEGQNESQQNIFAQMLSVESSEIPKDPCTDREKSPTSPFILVTPFDVDRGRSLVKSVSFILANYGKVNAIYKLCRYIRDQQQKSIQDTQNVAKSDVLSDDFWNILIYN